MTRIDPFAPLRRQFAAARRDKLRHRDIAASLGVSEGELIAAHVADHPLADSPLHARRLQPRWPALVAALEPLGELMALTRNEACVHEKIGAYRGACGSEMIGMVLGEAIDLRLFYSQWAHGFAVHEALADGRAQRSLQEPCES